MKRLATFVALLVFVPVLAAAQVPPSPPPAPPAPRVAPAPAPAPAPVAPVAPASPFRSLYGTAVEEAFQAAREFNSSAFREQVDAARQGARIDSQVARELAEQARQVARVDNEEIRRITEQAREMARHETDRVHELRMQLPHLADVSMHAEMALQDARVATNNFVFQENSDSGLFNSGLNAANQGQYDRAITYFDRVIAQRGTRADGALYWKAFAQYKLAKSDDALATLGLLRKEHAQSRYLGDAKVLEADVRKVAGQPVNPAALADDEMKVLAIQGLGAAKSEQMIPMLEGVLNATNSLRVKKAALYVVALSADPRARPILLRYAKGGGNPDLQMEAIRYLATRSNRETAPEVNKQLLDIYQSTPDVTVKREIINALRSSGSKDQIISIVQNTTTPVEIRRSGISSLSGLVAPAELMSIYQKETDRDLRIQIISVFQSMGAIDQIQQIVKTEKDPAVRQRAIRSLGSQRADRTGQALVDLYSADQDLETRRAVISALSSQNNAEGLVGIARKEASLELKRDIVKRLSEMAPKSKAAADYLMEVIK
jgi:TolA-binding protein